MDDEKQKGDGGAMVQAAGMLCRDPKFSAWLSKSRGVVLVCKGGLDLEGATAAALRAALIVDSRAELATNEGAQDRLAILLNEYRGSVEDDAAS